MTELLELEHVVVVVPETGIEAQLGRGLPLSV